MESIAIEGADGRLHEGLTPQFEKLPAIEGRVHRQFRGRRSLPDFPRGASSLRQVCDPSQRRVETRRGRRRGGEGAERL